MWAGADGRYDVMTECPQDEVSTFYRGLELSTVRRFCGPSFPNKGRVEPEVTIWVTTGLNSHGC
jgi:hypothetical protein